MSPTRGRPLHKLVLDRLDRLEPPVLEVDHASTFQPLDPVDDRLCHLGNRRMRLAESLGRPIFRPLSMSTGRR